MNEDLPMVHYAHLLTIDVSSCKVEKEMELLLPQRPIQNFLKFIMRVH